MRFWTLILLSFMVLLYSWGEGSGAVKVPDGAYPMSSVANISYTVTGQYPHDTNSFTEGFLFHDGRLYEGTAYVPELQR